MTRSTSRVDALDAAFDHLSAAERMHALEARPSTLVSLLAINDKAARTLTRHLDRKSGRAAAPPTRGRAPESLGPVMMSYRSHLEASEFLQFLWTSWHQDHWRFDRDAFIALYELHCAGLQREGATPELTFEHALLVADHANRGKLRMVRCELCSTHYLQTIAMIQVGEMLSHGECPYCRQLSSATGSGGGRLRINPTSKRRFLRILGKNLDHAGS